MADAYQDEATPWRNKELLQELYLVQDLSQEAIADELGCGVSTVSNWIRRHDLISRPWRDEAVLRELFVENTNTVHEAAEKLNCDMWTVNYWLAEHDIPVRPWKDKELLKELFVQEALSTEEISDKFECHSSTIKRWVKNHDIPNDFKKDRGTVVVECHRCGVEFERQYNHAKRDHRNFCSEKCRNSWMADRTGEAHPLFQGGRPTYGEGWNENKKEAVRNRDGRECQYCGLTEDEHFEQYGRKLSVHHIVPARKFDDPKKRNAKENLEVVCIPCHRYVEQMAPLRPDHADATAD